MSFRDEIKKGWKEMLIIGVLAGVFGAAAGATLDKFVPIDSLMFKYGSMCVAVFLLTYLYGRAKGRWLKNKAERRGRTNPCWGCIKFNGGNRNYIGLCRRCARRTQVILIALVIGILVSAVVRQIAVAIISNAIVTAGLGLAFGFAAALYFVLKVRLTK